MTYTPQYVDASTNRALYRLVVATGLSLVFVLATSAQAGFNVFLTPVEDPLVVPGASGTGLGAPSADADWASYILGVSGDDGSQIQAVDVSLVGTFRQELNWDADAECFVSTPNGLNISGGDSHLLTHPDALFAVAPTEDNSLLSSGASLPALPGTLDNGLGSSMRTVWGVPRVTFSSMNLAYLVIPRGSESQLQYAIDGAGPNGDMLFQFRQGAAFPPPPPKPLPLPPVVEPPIASPPIAPPSVDPPGTITPPPPPSPTTPQPPVETQPPIESAPPTPVPPPNQIPGLITKFTRVPFAGASTAPAGLAAYQLDAQSVDGSLIAALDVSIAGPLHQKWTNADGESELTPTPKGRASDGGIDSHMTIPSDALVIRSTEDNNADPNTVASGATAEGTGSTLSGIWGMVGDKESDFAHVAYLVLPAGTDPASLDIQLRAYTPTGDQFISQLQLPIV